MEPPVSVASPIVACPSATADAGPLDEPPGRAPGTRPFGGVP